MYRFDARTESEFQEFELRRQIIPARYTTALMLVVNGLLAIRDFTAHGEIAALAIRGAITFTILVLHASTYSNRLGLRFNQSLSVTCFAVTNGLFFLLDYMASMPRFFLPNALTSVAFVGSFGLGLSFRRALLSHLLTFSVYLEYALGIRPGAELQSQLANVLVNFSIAIAVSFLLERGNRIAFHQRKKLLQANQLLDQSNDAKNKILSMLSHDLSGPLNNLSSVLNLKNEGLLTNEEFTGLSARIRQNVDATSAMLNGITQWSKTQMAGFSPALKTIQVCGLVNEVLGEFGTMADEKRILIRNEVPEVLNCLADKEMVKVALRNILSNSIKFSEPQKSIRVLGAQRADWTKILIQDEGTGISAGDMEKIFTLQIKSQPGTRNEKGTGIGLQLTHDLIRLNGGKIEVASELGKGSVFTLWLPAESKNAE